MVKRLWWGIFFIALIALLVSALYLGQNFVGLGPIPTRLAFAGRLPSIEGDPRVFKFFYATNRQNSEDTFNGYGNTLSEKKSFGTFETRIAADLEIKPFVWFDVKRMELVRRQELPDAEFFKDLTNAIQDSPKKSVLIIVWGFRDWFRSAALKTAYTGYVLDIETPVVLFDWPGNQGEGRRGYLDSQIVATKSASDLGHLIASIVQETGAENVWLMASSLGCQTTCDALVWLKKQPDLFVGKPKLSHVVLSAPDVSAQTFDEEFANDIKAVSQHLTAYVSSNDRALLMSDWINRGRRLGRKANAMLPPDEQEGEYEFEEAWKLLELQSKGAREISIVDATPINRLRNLHHFFTDSSEFFDDLYQRLLRPDDIVSRRLHSVRTRDNMHYWILWND